MERPLAQQGPPRRQGEEKALEDAAAALEAHAAAALIAAGAAADDESPGPSAAADDDVDDHVSEEFCNTVTETEGGYCGGEKYPVAAGAFCKWTFCPAPATTS